MSSSHDTTPTLEATPQPPSTASSSGGDGAAPAGGGSAAAACEACGTVGVELHRCPACNAAVYCGRACQVADWSVHKQWCVEVEEEKEESIEEDDDVEATVEAGAAPPSR